jgi:hypothetical protein
MRTVIALVAALCLGPGLAVASGQHASTSSPDAHAAAPAQNAGHTVSAETAKAKPDAHATAAEGAKEPPKVAPAEAKSAKGHDDVRPAVERGGKSAEPGTPKGEKPASVTPAELASRLQKVLDEDAARRKRGTSQSAVPVAPAAKKSSAGKPVARPAALLKWEATNEPEGVRLSWDPQIDPRRIRRAEPKGVRLTWPEGL